MQTNISWLASNLPLEVFLIAGFLPYQVILGMFIGHAIDSISLAHAPPRKSYYQEPAHRPTGKVATRPRPETKEGWTCWNCGCENDEDAMICSCCGVVREAQYNADYAGAGANDFGGDPLWDDDQHLQ